MASAGVLASTSEDLPSGGNIPGDPIAQLGVNPKVPGVSSTQLNIRTTGPSPAANPTEVVELASENSVFFVAESYEIGSGTRLPTQCTDRGDGVVTPGGHQQTDDGPVKYESRTDLLERIQNSKSHRPARELSEGAIIEDHRERLVIGNDGHYNEGAEYELRQCLGRGAFGRVCKCQDRLSGWEFCLKMIERVRFKPEEITALVKTYGHPGTVQMFGSLSVLNYVYILMEYIPGVTLDAHLRQQKSLQLDSWTVLDFSRQAVDVLLFLRSKQIVHNDLHAGNWMVTQDETGRLRLKLVDFGLAQTRVGREKGHPIGACRLWSPEKARSDPCAWEVDLWAYGCTAVQQLAGADKYPLHDFSTAAMIWNVANHLRSPVDYAPKNIPTEISDLLKKLFAWEVDKRLAVEHVLEQPAFKLLEDDPHDPKFWSHVKVPGVEEGDGPPRNLHYRCHSSTDSNDCKVNTSNTSSINSCYNSNSIPATTTTTTTISSSSSSSKSGTINSTNSSSSKAGCKESSDEFHGNPSNLLVMCEEDEMDHCSHGLNQVVFPTISDSNVVAFLAADQ